MGRPRDTSLHIFIRHRLPPDGRPMEFMEVIRRRRSIRCYKEQDIPEQILNEILEAGRLAPSGGNRQPWHFILVRDPGRKVAMGAPDWAAKAPIILAVCGDPEASENWYIVDPSIAMEHMVLAAANRGIGTCWIGTLNHDEQVKRSLGIPEHMVVIAFTPLGYPDESPPPKDRKPLEAIVHDETF